MASWAHGLRGFRLKASTCTPLTYPHHVMCYYYEYDYILSISIVFDKTSDEKETAVSNKEWKPSRTWTMSLLALWESRATRLQHDSLCPPKARVRRHRHHGQHLQDCGSTTKKRLPDGGRDFAPRKRRRPRCRRRRGDGSVQIGTDE